MADHEINLDPDDWDQARRDAHSLLDSLFDRLQQLPELPAWRALPDSAREQIRGPLPREGEPLDVVCDTLRESVIPYPTGNISPRFYGWVMGNGTVDGLIADMVASGMNAHLAGYDQSASVVEAQTIEWCCELMGYPADAGGLFVSGGTMANLIGLIVARSALDPDRIRADGIVGLPRLRVYGSTATHSWAEKGCDMMGLGRGAVVRVAADSADRIDLDALDQAVQNDRAAGALPLAVIANVGTVDGGAIDDLHALADFCERESLWLHVDGAFGALLAFSETLRDRVDGMARADSIAFDLHKWGFLQYEIGAVLVRDATLQKQAFATQAAYLTPPGRGIQPDDLHFAAIGPQLSRGFRALKAWVALRHHGSDKIGRVIAQNVAQAQHLVSLIQTEPRLQLFEPSDLNIVCFRYIGDGTHDAATLDAWNREILLRIQESGLAVPSSTQRQGCFALRVAITNHRATIEDMDALLSATLEHGTNLDAR